MGWFVDVFGSIASMVSNWFTGKRDLQKAKLATLLVLEKEKAKRAHEIEMTEATWGVASLRENYKWTRAIILFLLFVPIIATVIDPVAGEKIFSALNLVPKWYWSVFVVVILADFGVQVGFASVANAIRSIFSRQSSSSSTK